MTMTVEDIKKMIIGRDDKEELVIEDGIIKQSNSLKVFADKVMPFIRMRPDYFEITITPRRSSDSGEHPDPQYMTLDFQSMIELRNRIMKGES